MIIGAHSIIYSTNADADRSFLKDVLKLTSVDVGGGWLIFGLPPSEVAVHPSDENGVHELYLMVDDVEAFIAAMAAHDLSCDPVQNQGWGLLTRLALPGGGKLGVYQPRHARPEPMGGPQAAKAKPAARRAPKKPAKAAKKPPKKIAKKPARKKAKRR